MLIVGIYEIAHVTLGYRYVGSTASMKRRLNKHRSSLNNGNHHSRPLQEAWTKYGADAFVIRILEECSVDQLVEREQHHMDQTPPGLSLNKNPSSGSCLGVKRSEARRQLHSQHSKALWADPEHRAMRTAKNKAMASAPEQRAARSARLEALWADPERAAQRCAAMKGKRRKKGSGGHIRTRWATDPAYRTKMLAAMKEGKRKKEERRIRSSLPHGPVRQTLNP